LNAWDIYSLQPAGWPDAHPAVIVSHPKRVAYKGEVNVLMCSTKPATRPAQEHEVILDAADGLNWPTPCKCDFLHQVQKSELKHFRGHVTEERRRTIIATMMRANGWT